jgi:hypothetical protein
MTDETSTPRPTGVRLTGSDGGVEFELNLDRSELLPGQLTGGTVRLAFQRGMEFRGSSPASSPRKSGNGGGRIAMRMATRRRTP